MVALRSLLFNIFFFTWCTLVLVGCLPALLRQSWCHWVGRFLTSGIFWGLKWICNIRYEIRGRENLPELPFLIAAKHQSAWDTFVFSLILEMPSFVLKRELTWIPFYGWYIRRAGIVPIDRGGGASELKRMVASARKIADGGQAIIIFPEGTRVPPDQARPFHPGIAALYSQLKLPVVPVALNSGLCWPRRSFLKKPGKIVLEILPPIPAGLKRRDLMARAERDVQDASARLVAAARAGES